MLTRRHANERIALFLHGLGERLGHIGQSPLQFRLAMSREDLASYLGLEFVTVSRGFTRLQDDGVIAASGRRVDVLEPVALARRGHGGDPPEEQRRRAGTTPPTRRRGAAPPRRENGRAPRRRR